MDDEQPLPIRIVVTDDLERSRVTVFFRLFLAIPHLIVVVLLGIAAFAVTVILWIALVFEGKAPRTLQEFVALVPPLRNPGERVPLPRRSAVPDVRRRRGVPDRPRDRPRAAAVARTRRGPARARVPGVPAHRSPGRRHVGRQLCDTCSLDDLRR